MEAVRHQALKMPPQGKLPEAEIAVLEKWIRLGAPIRARPRLPRDRPLHASSRSHWSFQSIVQPPLPRVSDDGWPRADVDRFILARLEAEGLSPVGDAERGVLLRRVYFDLIGLPPQPDELAEFLADDSPDALDQRGG